MERHVDVAVGQRDPGTIRGIQVAHSYETALSTAGRSNHWLMISTCTLSLPLL